MDALVYAKAVIFNQNGEVLLLRRSKTDPRRPGEQDFPGGNVEKGESVNDGVSREIMEETGLTVAPHDLHLIYGASQLYSTESVTRLLFWGIVHDPEVKLSYEHDGYHWVSAEKATLEFPHPFYGAGLIYGLKHKLFPVTLFE